MNAAHESGIRPVVARAPAVDDEWHYSDQVLAIARIRPAGFLPQTAHPQCLPRWQRRYVQAKSTLKRGGSSLPAICNGASDITLHYQRKTALKIQSLQLFPAQFCSRRGLSARSAPCGARSVAKGPRKAPHQAVRPL